MCFWLYYSISTTLKNWSNMDEFSDLLGGGGGGRADGGGFANRRKRAASGPKRPRDPKRIAMAIGARQKQMYPYSEFGRAFLRRGTPEGIGRFGETWKAASAEQRAARKAVGYSGRGMYSGAGSYRDFLGGARDTYETFVPKSWRDELTTQGRDLIRSAGGMISGSMRGRGMYSGRGGYNELVSSGAVPISMSGSGDETSSITISNREYISDFTAPGTANFTNLAFDINPGLPNVFPWLSQIAANYEEYQFQQLVFEYHPTIQENTSSTTGQTGSLILATNYNPSQPVFIDKEVMMQYHGGQSDRVTQESKHGVECDPAKSDNPRRYVRTAPVVIGQDLKSFDLGKFQAAVANIPDAYFNQQLGELWVYYTIKLSVPKLGTARGDAIQEDIWVANLPGPAEGAPAVIFDGNVLKAQQSSIGCTLVTTASSAQSATWLLTFPPSLSGDFEIRVRLESALSVLQTPTCATSVSGQVVNVPDMYAVDATTSRAPSFRQEVTQATRYSLIWHVATKAQVKGLANTAQIVLTGAGAWTASQACFEVVERSRGFYQTPTIPQPALVNAAGVVVNIG